MTLQLKQLPYFKVITNEDGNSAEMLIYGYIGQDYWWSEELREESLTDIAIVRELRRLEASYSRINIRINSPGGLMYHGNAIINAIRRSKAEIHTYNDGLAASMAADIWMAGKYRHMASNALLMVHTASSYAWGTAQDFREQADVLDKFSHTAIVIMQEATSLSYEEIKQRFYDYKDHWFNAEEAAELGLINGDESYEAENVLPDMEKLSLREITKLFLDNQEGKGKENGFQNLQKMMGETFRSVLQSVGFSNSTSKSISTPNILPNKSKKDMNINELKASLGKDVTEAEVIQLLEGQGYQIEKKTPEPEEKPEEKPEDTTVSAEKFSEILEKQLKPLQERLQKLEEAPATTPTTVPAGEDNTNQDVVLTEAEKAVQETNKELEEYAAAGKNIKITAH